MQRLYNVSAPCTKFEFYYYPAYWYNFVENIKLSNINLIKFELYISSVKNGNVPLHL